MIYTILSARYANPEHTAAEILTAESAAVMISEEDRPQAWAEFKVWEKANATAVFAVVPPRIRTPSEKLEAALGITVAELKAELARP